MDTLTYLLNRAAELNAEIPKGLQDVRSVTVPKLNVRSGPGTSFSWLRWLQYGDQVNVIETDGQWAKISPHEWAFADYLRKVE